MSTIKTKHKTDWSWTEFVVNIVLENKGKG